MPNISKKSPLSARTPYSDAKMGRILSRQRVIRRVAAPWERTVAWVFEYSPTIAPTQEGRGGFTEQLLDLMREYGARATFGVFGSTAENYPDEPDARGNKHSGGKKYAHIPAFGLDDMAGAEAGADVVRRIAREGHEPANYTYRCLPYSPDRELKLRESWRGAEDAERDLRRLHDLVYRLTHFNMRFSRPPLDIDALTDGTESFDIYERMGYHRLAPGIEYGTGGPEPLGSMTVALEREPTALSGAIIARRDGTAPDLESIRAELELFESHGYRVLTVGELMERSAFEDVPRTLDCFDAVNALDRAGFTVGFRNNKFYPEREITPAELDVFLAPPGAASAGARIAGGGAVKPLTIAAKAQEFYARVEGKPRTASRADAAMWLADTAHMNGLL